MNQLVPDATLATDAALLVGACLEVGELRSYSPEGCHAYATYFVVFRDVETTTRKLVD